MEISDNEETGYEEEQEEANMLTFTENRKTHCK